MIYIAGSEHRALERLRGKEGYQGPYIMLHFSTQEEMDNENPKGWVPYPSSVIFSFVPDPGDLVALEGYLGIHATEEDVDTVIQQQWRVIERKIVPGYPSAINPWGFIQFIVEHVPHD